MACKLEESSLCSNDNLVWKDAAVKVISPVSPWNNIENLLKEQSTLSFKDILAEELERNLIESKEENCYSHINEEANCSSYFLSKNCITPQEDFSYLTDSDEENSREYDQEFDSEDATLSERRNAECEECSTNFPPNFDNGDKEEPDCNIDDKVYNALLSAAKKEGKKKERIKDKYDFGLKHKGVSVRTRKILSNMLEDKILESVNDVIGKGKESIIFHANGRTYEELVLSEDCAVKIFKTSLAYFKSREKYIRDDCRFKDRMAKINDRPTILLYAEKEFDNLRRLHRAKIPCPKPLLVKDHVLVMSFIGDDKTAAPQLVLADLTPTQWNVAYRQVVEIMTAMFRTCNLVHSDLSEYNLLWHKNEVWVIDLGQAVEPIHPNGLQFLYRDCENIVGFFKSKGVTNISSPFELFKTVSGLDLYSEEDAERMIENYEKSQEMWHEASNIEKWDDFEFLYNDLINIKELEEELGGHLEGYFEGYLEGIPEVDSSDEDIIFEDTEDYEGKKKNRRIKKKKKNVPLIPLESETTSPNQVATISTKTIRWL